VRQGARREIPAVGRLAGRKRDTIFYDPWSVIPPSQRHTGDVCMLLHKVLPLGYVWAGGILHF
jgi:hypothetical protein